MTEMEKQERQRRGPGLPLSRLVRPDGQSADCVCCGESEQNGRYEGLPCCFPCYEKGLLKKWLVENNASDWPNTQAQATQPAPINNEN